jgi:hypothetical protein
VRAPLDLSKQKTPGFLIIHTNGIRVLFLGMRELSEREREREREREVLSYEKQCENHFFLLFLFDSSQNFSQKLVFVELKRHQITQHNE